MIIPDPIGDRWRDGLRVLSLSHYGVGLYAYGTETAGGVTPFGRDLLKQMKRLGIILDVSHLADDAFWEALELFDGT